MSDNHFRNEVTRLGVIEHKRTKCQVKNLLLQVFSEIIDFHEIHKEIEAQASHRLRARQWL